MSSMIFFSCMYDEFWYISVVRGRVLMLVKWRLLNLQSGPVRHSKKIRSHQFNTFFFLLIKVTVYYGLSLQILNTYWTSGIFYFVFYYSMYIIIPFGFLVEITPVSVQFTSISADLSRVQWRQLLIYGYYYYLYHYPNSHTHPFIIIWIQTHSLLSLSQISYLPLSL